MSEDKELEIKQLQERERALATQIAALEGELATVEQRLAELTCPFQVGDVVEKDRGYGAGRWKIEEIKAGYRSLVGRQVKKDGTLGKKVMELWPEDYRKVD